jgi:hypothetical protein
MDSPIQTDGHLLWEITIFHGKTHNFSWENQQSQFLMGKLTELWLVVYMVINGWWCFLKNHLKNDRVRQWEG